MTDIITENQFVTFRVKEELYGINVNNTKEILEIPEITKVPGMSDLVRGVINIRGSVVPVLDLKMKFGFENTEFTQDAVIIVTEIAREDEMISIGLIVDAARDVVTLEDGQIEPPPKMGIFKDNNYLSGMGKVDDRFIIILDIDRILSDEELDVIKHTEE